MCHAILIPSTRVQEAFVRPDPLPVGGTPKSATSTAALAADANNSTLLDYDEEDIMGGQGLVEAVFSGMFEDEFDGVMPIRNHKVCSCLSGCLWHSVCRSHAVTASAFAHPLACPDWCENARFSQKSGMAEMVHTVLNCDTNVFCVMPPSSSSSWPDARKHTHRIEQVSIARSRSSVHRKLPAIASKLPLCNCQANLGPCVHATH